MPHRGLRDLLGRLAGDPYWTEDALSFDVMVEGGVSHPLRVRVGGYYEFSSVNVRGDPYDNAVVPWKDWHFDTVEVWVSAVATEAATWSKPQSRHLIDEILIDTMSQPV